VSNPLNNDQSPQFDDQDLDINPVTGELDLITDFNTGRIVTSEFIHTGSLRVAYDTASASYVKDNPMVVISNNGAVVKT